MGAKLASEWNDTIPAKEMKDGQIGVIREWCGNDYRGCIIQRFKDKLISIGMEGKYNWDPIPADANCRVRILQPGEQIVITETD